VRGVGFRISNELLDLAEQAQSAMLAPVKPVLTAVELEATG